MDKDDLVSEIGNMLLEDAQIAAQAWRYLVMVAQITPASTEVEGFAYPESGDFVPTSPHNFQILKKFEELRTAMHDPSKEPWKACLVTIDRISSDMTIKFEYDHPDKWLITPDTIERIAEALRPDQMGNL